MLKKRRYFMPHLVGFTTSNLTIAIINFLPHRFGLKKQAKQLNTSSSDRFLQVPSNLRIRVVDSFRLKEEVTMVRFALEVVATIKKKHHGSCSHRIHVWNIYLHLA